MARWLLNLVVPPTAVAADYRHPLGGHHGWRQAVTQHEGVPIDHDAVARYVSERALNLPPLGYYKAGTGR